MTEGVTLIPEVTVSDFPHCGICGSNGWRFVYQGEVRDGAFGRSRSGQIARCASCGVERLAESICLKPSDYQGEEYRRRLDQDHDPRRHFEIHDELSRFTLESLGSLSLRGKIIADVGCGGGSLLDHLRGVCAEALAIDPDRVFGASLQQRGYRWFASVAEAAESYSGHVDVALTVQVIEHVEEPRAFMREIRKLLAPGGSLFVSTPNRRDVLMDLLPIDFPSFFYRTQHRWYFDAASLTRCAEEAGFKVAKVGSVHRYGLANALLWLRDRKPTGRACLASIAPELDSFWRAYLEAKNLGDNLFAILSAP